MWRRRPAGRAWPLPRACCPPGARYLSIRGTHDTSTRLKRRCASKVAPPPLGAIGASRALDSWRVRGAAPWPGGPVRGGPGCRGVAPASGRDPPRPHPAPTSHGTFGLRAAHAYTYAYPHAHARAYVCAYSMCIHSTFALLEAHALSHLHHAACLHTCIGTHMHCKGMHMHVHWHARAHAHARARAHAYALQRHAHAHVHLLACTCSAHILPCTCTCMPHAPCLGLGEHAVQHEGAITPGKGRRGQLAT